MLDPWIIEEIRRREEDDERDERPMLEIPLRSPEEEAEDRAISEGDQDEERGVVVVDFRV